MVCQARTKSARSFDILDCKYIGWYEHKNMNPVDKVIFKVLPNCMLHTYQGVIGYYLKEVDKEHFEHCMFNVFDDDVSVGRNLHSVCGKADLKLRVTLTNKNITEKMYVWRKYKCQRLLDHVDFLDYPHQDGAE